MSSETYLFSLVDAIQAKCDALGYDALSPAEQVFFCVWTLEAEVNNGGFNQFYFNSSGDIAHHAPAAFRAIGAPLTAEIIEKANSVFGSGGPATEWGDRQELVDALDDSANEGLEELDNVFLAYRENLSELLASFMRGSA